MNLWVEQCFKVFCWSLPCMRSRTVLIPINQDPEDEKRLCQQVLANGIGFSRLWVGWRIFSDVLESKWRREGSPLKDCWAGTDRGPVAGQSGLGLMHSLTMAMRQVLSEKYRVLLGWWLLLSPESSASLSPEASLIDEISKGGESNP